ncbi:IclR family transcriptional regulator [uncultured Tessaracoccus sp.]|uniref:IclR family transcriptional regulator n=1 Tax=uncultured Tessaracoccus sp. TaxID=905023 RepID=UPI00263382DA|nr:helix-turn-helix domain-containing protein [uncultured Tessaracoccus sp.]
MAQRSDLSNPAPRDSGPVFVEAIDRALILLSALSEAGSSGQSLGTLCEMTAIRKPTAYRALATMKARGFVAQTPTGEYRLGRAAITLGAEKSGEQYLVGALKGVLSALSRRADELVHLGTWHGDHVVYLDKVEPATRAIRVWSSVGQQVPIASSALGRALLGAAPRTGAFLMVGATPSMRVLRFRCCPVLDMKPLGPMPSAPGHRPSPSPRRLATRGARASCGEAR